MRQAPGVVCEECSSVVPAGHQFCGACGAEVDAELLEVTEEYYGVRQVPGKARLVLIRGVDGVPGNDYMLLQAEHAAGGGKVPIRYEGDDWLSDNHALFTYDEGKLFVSDQDSLNGVFVRIDGSVTLEPDQRFICGDTVFAVEMTPKDSSAPSEDGTQFYASPIVTSPFRVVHWVEGGRRGMVSCAQGSKVRIGRIDCNMNFIDDRHMSPRHASLSMGEDGAVRLLDDNSTNGVFVQIQEAHELQDGDYLMIGRQLLRVEFTTA